MGRHNKRNSRNANGNNNISSSTTSTTTKTSTSTSTTTTTTTSTLKITLWFLFGIAQCLLIKMYHDAAYKNTTTTTTTTTDEYSMTNSQSHQTHSEQFERELILQGIIGTGNNNKNKGQQKQEQEQEQEQDKQFKKKKKKDEKEKQIKPPPEKPDGIFNGYPIYKFPNKSKSKKNMNMNMNTDTDKNRNNEKLDNKNKKNNEEEELLYSQFHCVGETWEPPIQHRKSKVYVEQTWMHRSCRFQLLCYDTYIEEYVIYLDPTKHTPIAVAVSNAGSSSNGGSNGSSSNGSSSGSDTVSSTSSSSSKLIQELIQKQNEKRKKTQDINSSNSTTSTSIHFKQPSYFDDTSTVYRNNTVIVDGLGQTLVDTHWNTNDKNDEHKYGDTSYGVAIGSMNGKWGEIDGQRLKWFPTIRWKSINDINIDDQDDNDNIDDQDEDQYEIYTLPSSVIMIPFHSLSASNPGHLVWDDFLPMYTLLEMYGFSTANSDNNDDNDDDSGTMDDADLLPIRYILPGERGLWAGCDWLDERAIACHKMLQKFAQLMGTIRSKSKYNQYYDDASSIPMPNNQTTTTTMIPITTNKAIELKLFNNNNNNNNNDKKKQRKRKSKPKTLICSKNGLAGFGGISDHGDGKVGHGWDRKDYRVSQNSGRSQQLYNFRNYMINNLFYNDNNNNNNDKNDKNNNNNNNKENNKKVIIPNKITDLQPNEPLLVIFSSYSSQTRGVSFRREAEQLRQAIQSSDTRKFYGLPPSSEMDIVVETQKLSDLSLKDQILLASKTSVFVTYCGGGAITASFLPRGGSVIIYYKEKGGIESNRHTRLPARLDWDFFNNIGFLHVNWVPADSRLKIIDQKQNENLILEELSRIYKQRKLHYNIDK